MIISNKRKKYSKSLSVLNIFERLLRGEVIRTSDEIEKFNVSKKTIKRYIKALRNYLAEFSIYDATASIIYDQKKKGYVLERKEDNWLSKKEVLVLVKILLESRALTDDEMFNLLDKIILQAIPEEQEHIREVIKNERFHYTPVNHGMLLIEVIWNLSECIRRKKIIELRYKSLNRDNPVIHKVKPVGIIFSDFYFYLIAYMCDRDYDHPTVFRIDRIQSYEEFGEKFRIPYQDRFKEGEFRKRVQFMYSGELSKIKFRYLGSSPQYVLDRLPTAQIIEREEESFIIEAEVYSEYGFQMWLLSQTKYIEVLEPKSLRNKMRNLITEILEVYQ